MRSSCSVLGTRYSTLIVSDLTMNSDKSVISGEFQSGTAAVFSEW